MYMTEVKIQFIFNPLFQGTGRCVSKGNHHDYKVRRDNDFQEFMKKLMDFWCLQYQGQGSVSCYNHYY